MKSVRRFIRNSFENFVEEFNSIHKKESLYMTAKQTPPKTINTIKLSKNEYFELDKFFLRFFNSKPIRGMLSGKSLAFVIGPENIGKTQYIEKNISEIRKRKKQLESSFVTQKYPEFDATTSPESYDTKIQEQIFDNNLSLIIKKNYKEEGGQLNFRNFIEDLHDEMISQIHEMMVKFEDSQKINQRNKNFSNQQTSNSNKDQRVSLLTPQIIKEIVIHEYAPEYIFIHIKDAIFAIIQEKDMILLKKQYRQVLEQWNEENLYGGVCTVEHFFDKLYHPLIQILWKGSKQSICDLKASEEIQKSQIAIKLFYSIFSRIQYEHRHPNHTFQWYHTGIQTSNFVFDLLNFLSGTGKYLEALQNAYTKAQTPSERQEVKQFLQKSNNFILLGNHIDVMLCLINLEDLMCFKNKSKAFLDLFDHLVCRTVNSNNIRKHFPVVIQIPNRAFLDDTFQLGKIQGSNPVIIEIPGYIQHFMKSTNMIQIFEEKHLIRMFHSFGRNPHTWKLMIENMAKGFSMEEIQDGKAPYQVKQKFIAQAKMNRLFTSARCLKYLDDRTLDFEIREVLELYSKINGMGNSVSNFVGTVLFKQPYFTTMMEQNIFYHMYYLPYVDYAVNLPAYLSFFRDEYLKKLKRNHWELDYKKWRWFEKEYSLMRMDLRYKRNLEKLFLEQKVFGKQHVDLQFSSTYYSPVEDFGVKYYHNAHGVRNFNP